MPMTQMPNQAPYTAIPTTNNSILMSQNPVADPNGLNTNNNKVDYNDWYYSNGNKPA